MTQITDVITTAASKSEDRRSLKWIDPRFQRRYAILLISIVLLVSTVLIGTFWFHSQQVLQTLTNAGVIKTHSLYLLMENQMHHLITSVCVVVVLFSAFMFVMANFLSHRIVGPLFSVKRSLEKIGEGDLDGARIRLRSDDEFHDVAEMVNSVIDRLASK